MTAIQPALDGTVPKPRKTAVRQQMDDFETWVDVVWEAFVRAADSGLPFTTSEIQQRENLPDPPNPKAQWGHLPGRLVKAGLIEPYVRTGKSSRGTVHKSLVNMWIGVPSYRRTGAAA